MANAPNLLDNKKQSLSQDEKPKNSTAAAVEIKDAPKNATKPAIAETKVSSSVKKEAEKIIAKAKEITEKEATPANTNSTKAAEPKK